MCLATAYVKKHGKEELCMKNVELVSVSENRVRLADIMARQIEVSGTIKEINLTDNLIYIEADPSGEV